MKQPRLGISHIIILVFFCLALFIGIFCFTQLEIVPGVRWEAPSREVRANPYFALDKWLGESGYPVRILSMGSLETILNGPEKTVFVEISRFNWTGDSSMLLPWLREGGRLILSLDAKVHHYLSVFMESLGVKVKDPFSEDLEPTEAGIKIENESDAEEENEKENTPSFDLHSSFIITKKVPLVDRIFVMKNAGDIKLVKLKTGRGWITFTGKANFLHNYSLLKNENSNLAGELFLAERPPRGVLFIRTLNGERNLFGNLVERGNPGALLISLILLVIIGLWMTIPSFGCYRQASEEKPGKPLRERFLAEGRFLKKYRALGKYLEVYKKELE
ncbi:MAG: DUF4350 domain-containing protein, partial [Treponema sp.]|nr:DUF4350 domain-containing protein [Treponema sp.]